MLATNPSLGHHSSREDGSCEDGLCKDVSLQVAVDLIVDNLSDQPHSVIASIESLLDDKHLSLDNAHIRLHKNSEADTQPDYNRALRILFGWGIEKFAVDPGDKGIDLWLLMLRIDRLQSLERRLLSHQAPIRPEDDPAAVYYARSPPYTFPTIVAPTVICPVRPMTLDTTFIVEFMKDTPQQASVSVTTVNFGWPKLYQRLNCFFTDCVPLSGFVDMVITNAAPAVIISSPIKSLASRMERVLEIINPDNDPLTALKSRASRLRRGSPRVHVLPGNDGCFHGQSISVQGVEARGSFAVYLQLKANHTSSPVGLTCAHVSPFPNSVVTPGGLDIAAELCLLLGVGLDKLPALDGADDSELNRKVDFYLRQWASPAGQVLDSDLGESSGGYRSDWALIDLVDAWRSQNGDWHPDTLVDLEDYWKPVGGMAENYDPNHRVVGARDPRAGEMCIKVGASTGITAGKLAGVVVETFAKDSTLPPDEGQVGERYKTLLVRPAGERLFARGGDSGAAVFLPSTTGRGWDWGGIIISAVAEVEMDAAFIVPQSEVLRAIEEKRGVAYSLAITDN